MNHLERVREYINANRLFNEGETVIVAVSGGPDSLCLLHLLHLMSHEYKLKLVVAHLNHCLRPEACEEEKAVRDLAVGWSLDFESRSVDIINLKKERAISEEEAGRLARYQLFLDVAGQYKASTIALGHHLDDQAETVLLNVIRGTGPDGLAGIMPKSRRGQFYLVRPLLGLRRSEIEAYCLENNLQPFTDSSNLETNYTRNKLRLDLIPQLEEQYNPRIREALFGLASLAAADRVFLKKLAGTYFKKLAAFSEGETRLDRQALLRLPRALSSRVLRLALLKYIPAGKVGRLHIEQLYNLALSGKKNKELTLPSNTCSYCTDSKLILVAKRAGDETEPFVKKKLILPGKTPFAGGSSIVARITKIDDLVWPPPWFRAYLDFETLPTKNLYLCSRWPGARFYPQGAPGSKKLKEFLIDQKIPRQKRENLPLVIAGEEIVWIAGVRIAEPYRVTEKTRQVLQLEYRIRICRNVADNKSHGKGGIQHDR